jgi:hypothetical protein
VHFLVTTAAAAGNPKDKPPRVKWTSGWNVDADVVLETPKAYTVPAGGTLDYVYTLIPTNFENDTWITAGEIRPSDRSVVHHVSAFWRPPGSSWLKSAKAGVPYDRVNDLTNAPAELLHEMPH